MMSLKQRRSIVLLFALNAGIILLLTSQINLGSAAPPVSITATDNNHRTYDLFFYNGALEFYSYVVGSAAPVSIPIPSTLKPYFEPDYNFSTTWSDQNRRFLINYKGVLYHLSDNESIVQPVQTADQSLSADRIQSAQQGPDGKSLALILVHGDPDPEAFAHFRYLAVDAPDGKRHVLTGPTSVDTMNQPLMDAPLEAQSGPTGIPQWSPDGKNIAFIMYNQFNLRIINTACLSDFKQPCQIHTINPQRSDEGWYNVSWLPNGKLLMVCATTITKPTPTSDGFHFPGDAKYNLCTMSPDGSGYQHLYLPQTTLNAGMIYALSPDGKTLAFTQDDQSLSPSYIFFYDMKTGQIIDKFQTRLRIQYWTWMSAESIHALSQLPTPIPSPTYPPPTMKLSLRASCLIAGENSLTEDL